MSKQSSRQASKQGQNGQTTNKQANNKSSKQTVPANKQTTNVSIKQDRPQNKQAVNVSAKQTNPSNKPLTRQAAKQARRQQQQVLLLNAQRRARRQRVLLVSLIAAAVVLIAVGSVFVFLNSQKPKGQTQATPTEQVVNPAYPPIDGIYCDSLEQTAYHIHAHVTIYIDGNPVPIPQGIGIASDQSCLYWLHTHDSTGVIHIEAPKQVSPTLGDFLNIWGLKFQQSGFRNELALTAGWTVYVDGKQVNSTFNQLVLQPHMVITIAYNSPNITPDTTYSWQAGQ